MFWFMCAVFAMIMAGKILSGPSGEGRRSVSAGLVGFALLLTFLLVFLAARAVNAPDTGDVKGGSKGRDSGCVVTRRVCGGR
ncbi:MAG: hypothetical protein LBR53_10645 [Deltaproteobacteria bacterium]|jgi:hypothetical protein|nr:hypothetical protein [Deltaproteobacteria bacterium]